MRLQGDLSLNWQVDQKLKTDKENLPDKMNLRSSRKPVRSALKTGRCTSVTSLSPNRVNASSKDQKLHKKLRFYSKDTSSNTPVENSKILNG